MKNLIKDFIKNEDGVTAIEYAVIGVAMAAGLAVAIGSTKGTGSGLVGAINSAFTKISNSLKSA
ncbi:Flp family type IVb pilin [Vibrio sp. SCSIO 43136]|uniref:Flp family type IVb pilin n=1 Tax=Vibrio sp. SCSIO 43136 TaxID=2819101 RepID=UPI002076563D|nr:Flp family type IVb pilin [Vibrio sp. SCSIO 43136]USD67753.1 Flp family type IVb pilin [Vibrio sp. SCSIO 43136]